MDRLNKAQMEFMNGYVPATIDDVYEYQQGGAAGGDDQQAQIIALIKAYAQAKKVDPQSIIQKIQSLPEEQQMPYLESLAQELQGAQMQEGGSIPEEMVPQEQAPQGGGQIDPQQILQAVQQMLEEGAQPEEVIAMLLQEQVDPQMIVEVFVQLGMPQEQVMQEVQSVMEGGQEQEYPQEQMQEQGVEEPEGQPMSYGGTPYFQKGGAYNSFAGYDTYRAPGVIDNTKFNRGLLKANSLMDPTASPIPSILAAAPNNAFSAMLGIGAGALSAGAGVLAGPLGLFHNKKNEQNKDFIHNAYEQSSKIPGQLDLPNVDVAKNMSGKFPGAATGPLGATSNPFQANNYAKWKPSLKQNGGLAKAQGGKWMMPGFNLMEDPNKTNALTNDPKFGQTADYADSPGYDKQSAQGYNVLEYDPNEIDHSVTANKKVLNTKYMSGPGIAANAISGLGAVNTGLGYFENKEQNRRYNQDMIRNTNTMQNTPVYNSPNAFGDWTVNSGKLKPNMYVPTQDIGTSQYAKYGGTAKYQQGGEYHVTQDELIQLMRDGAEVEFL